MKAIVMARYGGPEVLELKDVPPPVPRPDEVVIRVHAASVNPVDWQIREGLVKLFIRMPLPGVLGCDLAGEVLRLGSAVRRLKVGDAVFAMMPHDWGAQAEQVALPEDLVALKPASLSFVEAASLGATGITAVHALRDLARVEAGAEVLINGASGGVGLASVQVAKALGAGVTAVCGAASFELVRGLGADACVDYRTTDFTRGSRQFDVIFDCIGNQPYAACRPVLRGAWTHVTTMPKGAVFVRALLSPLLGGRVAVVVAKTTPERIDWVRAQAERGRLRPVIDRVLPAAQVAEAQAFSQSGRAKGKIVLTFSSP
jgi:NADPH:quinone reductase-like Zn-dependent oxidoreductase